jgi:hypothetical protein
LQTGLLKFRNTGTVPVEYKISKSNCRK